MHLQVTFLSELTNTACNRLSPSTFGENKRYRKRSNLQWSKQHNPDKQTWSVWKKMITTIYCEKKRFSIPPTCHETWAMDMQSLPAHTNPSISLFPVNNGNIPTKQRHNDRCIMYEILSMTSSISIPKTLYAECTYK